MTANYDGYEIYDPGVHGLWRNLSRAAAKAAFRRLMEAKPARFMQLAGLFERDGNSLRPPGQVTDEDLDRLQSWFLRNLHDDGNGELAPESYSVVSDLALYIGDVMISRARNLSWGMYTASKRSSSYQESVIVGFQAVENPNYMISPGFLVAGLGRAKVNGEYINAHDFSDWVKAAVESDMGPV
jgi:hypothetical protein